MLVIYGLKLQNMEILIENIKVKFGALPNILGVVLLQIDHIVSEETNSLKDINSICKASVVIGLNV